MSYHFGQEKPAEAGFIFYTISMSIYYIFSSLAGGSVGPRIMVLY